MPRKNPGPPCSIEDCEKPAHARGFCGMHYYRWQQHGDPLVKRRRGFAWRDDISYAGAHVRVYATRGPASGYTCGCGQPAAQWAYSHADPDERQDERGRVYSLDPDHYCAMCVACHVLADRARRAAS